jgi:subtilase family serine protease
LQAVHVVANIALFQQKGFNVMSLSPVYRWRWGIVAALLILVLALSMLPLALRATHAAGSDAHAKPFSVNVNGHQVILAATGVKPPTDAQCRQQFGHPCYSPQEIRRAYGVDGLINKGDIGTGQTIIIIDSFGSPTIASDLHTFDMSYGLPDPPSLKIYSPLGTKPFNHTNGTMVGWAFETTLDVEWAHAMAPGANIALMTSPVAETQGVQGMPQFLFLEQFALDHNIGKIISQSWATTENTLFYPGGRQVFASFNNFYKQAAADHVTVFSSSGDGGVANPNFKGQIYPFPTVNFPASSPYVTAVGGTSLMATTSGHYQSEVAWSGSGGGVSQYWAEPDYQKNNLPSSVQRLLNGHRGVPDVSYNADPNTSILVYISFLSSSNNGFYFIGGTSEGSPQWAGIIADGNQFAGHPLGFINPAVYAIGNSSRYSSDFHDVTTGNNSNSGITGYHAKPGWDPVTGWGSPNAANLIPDIVNHQR